MWFVQISEQIVVTPLYSINWQVLITEAECLVRSTNRIVTNITQVNVKVLLLY
jgi:hypothetical protein